MRDGRGAVDTYMYGQAEESVSRIEVGRHVEERTKEWNVSSLSVLWVEIEY